MLSPATTFSSSSSSSSPSRAHARAPTRFAVVASARAARFRPARAMAASDDPRGGRSVAVVGAGVSGLAAAYRLRKRGVQVTVFEAADRAGGKIRTNSEGGFIWDEGANTMTESELEASRLIDDLGLQGKQQYPNSQHKRYIVKDGAPTLIPSDPIALMKSTVLSTKSKLKLFLEPFLYEKSSRRTSGKVVDYLIDPFVAGTSGGDPESLSIRHAFPALWNLENKYGSVIAGAILSKLSTKGDSVKTGGASPGKGRNKRVSFSFHGGMQSLIDALHNEVGDGNVKLGTEVLSLACCCDGVSSSGGWSISVDSKDAKGKDLRKNQSFDAVIMTAPLSNVQRMKFTKGGVPFVLDFLPKVDYLPLSLMVTAFKKEDVKKPLEGFGALIPYKEQQKHGLKTLGTLFSSMMFPDRAPNDQYLYTSFIGGSHNRDLAGAPTAILKQLVTSDLRKLLGNNKDGLAVGNVIASGSKAADLVISYLESCTDQDN
uniref:Protoporphyrinogen oxidase n=1 Tax=Oryza nivara TaxID=4536 RepID=A0A0E0H2G2_ORYNI